jgi:hypothetical protein
VHNYSQTKFTTTAPLYDVDNNTEIRPWEFARLSIGDQVEPASPRAQSSQNANFSGPYGATTSPAPPIRTLATGFEFAQSLCSDSKGNIYFCESRQRRIYRWSPGLGKPIAHRRLSLGTTLPRLRSKG